MTAAALLDRYGRRPGALGALSTSGAGASLIADRCAALGVPLAHLSPQTHAAIDAHKMFSRIGNPLDLGIFGGMRKSAEVPKLLLTDPSVSVAPGPGAFDEPLAGRPATAPRMGTAREASGVPLLLVTPGGLPEAERDTYRRMGIDTFTDTDILLEGIGALMAPEPDAPPTTPAAAAPACCPNAR